MIQLWCRPFKDVFGSFLCSIDFYYIYIYCKKLNAEFHKLIKTVGHHHGFFEKWYCTHLPLPTILNFIWIFSYSHLSSPKVVTKHGKVCKFCALIGCHCTKSLHKMCKTSWWKKFACCVSVRDFEPKILITGVHLTIKKTTTVW